MFLAITGYKGSGKDTFAQALLGNNNTSWLIYGNKPWLSSNDIPKVTCSLAQPIKTLVHNHIQLPYSEQIKDMLVPSGGTIPCIGGSSDGMTIRQMYIAVAQEAKKHNPYIWVETLISSNTSGIVTDVRFPCELERLHCPSIRIYRSKVAFPDDITETSLDDYRCDYFAVTEESEVILLITKFPQYTGYTLVSNIARVN